MRLFDDSKLVHSLNFLLNSLFSSFRYSVGPLPDDDTGWCLDVVGNYLSLARGL